jgi:hypothetical protein
MKRLNAIATRRMETLTAHTSVRMLGPPAEKDE